MVVLRPSQYTQISRLYTRRKSPTSTRLRMDGERNFTYFCLEISRNRYFSDSKYFALMPAALSKSEIKILGVARGLEYLHSQELVHSDIKPVGTIFRPFIGRSCNGLVQDNILISRTGEPQICDFGISRMLSPSQQYQTIWQTVSTAGFRGTIRYLSIEFVSDPKLLGVHTKESDVWAFGMTAYV